MTKAIVSDKTAKRRLLKLADFLENLDSELFNFSHYCEVQESMPSGMDPMKDPHRCGTTACALGWAPSLPFAKKSGFSLRTERIGDTWTSTIFTKNGKVIQPPRVWRELFGLSGIQADAIFQPGMSPFMDTTEDSSASDVADNIRKFVAVRYR